MCAGRSVESSLCMRSSPYKQMAALLKVRRGHRVRLPNGVLQLCFPQEDGVLDAKGSDWSVPRVECAGGMRHLKL